jgi:uncharacterized protein YcbK (DUF882 family)
MSGWKKAFASATVATALAAGLWAGIGSPAVSGGETRTLSLYHIHTGESLTVSYMVNGKYIPSALKKINYLMRDWRRKEVITIDPKTIDLVWELHADLGSHAPVHIVCGYRSAKTNSFLKRVGRNVAKRSQHVVGKAIDIYFPDVPTIKMRNSALVRRVGGVGYYRSSGGPTGFLHVDSGRVRHWGPGIGAREMAKIFRDYRKTVGARRSKRDQVMVADAKSNSPSQQEKKGKKTPAVETAYEEADDELAGMTAEASQTPKVAKPKLAEVAPEGIVKAYPVPKPRPKPIEVLMMAAVNMKIEPASAPPPTLVKKASPVSDSIGVVEASETMAELSDPVSNIAAKGSLAASLRNGTEADVPVIKTITASAAGADLFWWPQQIIFNVDQAVRRDGAPQPFGETVAGILPGSAEAAETPIMPKLARATLPELATGKGDMLVVNRQGKGSLQMPMSIAKRQTIGLLEDQ